MSKNEEPTKKPVENAKKYIKVRAGILIIFGIISLLTVWNLKPSTTLFSGSIYTTDGVSNYDIKAEYFIPQSVLIILGLLDILFGILAIIKSHHSRLKLIAIWMILRAMPLTLIALKTLINIGFQLYYQYFFIKHIFIIGLLFSLGSRSYYKSQELSLIEEYKIKQS